MAGNCENLATKAELKKLRQDLFAELSKYATQDALVRGDNETKSFAQMLFDTLLPIIAGLKSLLFDFVKRPEFQNFKTSTNQKLSNLKHTLDNLKDDIKALEQRIQKLNGKIEDIFSRLNALDTKINNFRSQLEEKIASNFGLIQALDGKVQKIQTKISVIEKEVEKLKGLESRVSNNESNIKTLDGNVKKALDLINDTRNKLNQTNKAVKEALNRANKALQAAYDAQSTADFALNAATEAQGRANDALSKANSNENRIGKLDSKINALQQESRSEDDKLRARIEALEKEIAKLKKGTGTVDKVARDKASQAQKKANTANNKANEVDKRLRNKAEPKITSNTGKITHFATRTITLTNEVTQLRNQVTKQGKNITNITQKVTNINQTVNIPQQFQQQLKETNATTKQLLTLTNGNTARITAIQTQTQPQAQKTNVKTGICESTQGGCLSNALNPILDGIGDLLNNQCPDLSLPDIAGSLTVDCNGQSFSFPYSGNGILGLESLMNALHQAQNACPDNQEQPPLVLAIPESWGQLVEANRPQLNVVYFYQDPEFPDKRSFWNLSIPHYKLSEVNTTKQLFPSYRKGNKMGVATLSDNSKIIVNGFDEANVNRVLDVLQMLVTKPVIDRRISHTNRQLSTEFVIPYKASFYPNGRQDAYTKKKLQPEWEKLFEEI